MKVNKEIQNYIETTIFPQYKNNEEAHNLDHILYVIKRSLDFASTLENIDYNMVYVIAAYHDIGHFYDAKNHEKISGEMLKKDKNLRKYFTEEQIETMKEAVEDHRASKKEEPRTIYGKIVSSADRNTNVDSFLRRCYSYRKKHNPNLTQEELIEESRRHAIDKFGVKGYASEKMYFKDTEFDQYLKELALLTMDKETFKKRFIEVNEIKQEKILKKER